MLSLIQLLNRRIQIVEKFNTIYVFSYHLNHRSKQLIEVPVWNTVTK